MELHKISAFSIDGQGGNPAGVAIFDTMPEADDMQKIAADVGYSETVFLVRQGNDNAWRVRYFSPESEVPFCGHATIALGYVLGQKIGEGHYEITLNDAQISVGVHEVDGELHIALQSPPTTSRALDNNELSGVLELFSLTKADLADHFLASYANAGAGHFILPLKSRKKLNEMTYDLHKGKSFMEKYDIVTIMQVFSEDEQNFHSRNAFASGGVWEDPATGAASAAFAGLLRDQNWPHMGRIYITQGEDMGMKSFITVDLNNEMGSSVRVSGSARQIVD